MNNFFMLVTEIFKYSFMMKAVIVGMLIALCCALLGVFLVLKKYSLIGDGLAHVSFASVAVALLLSASPLIVSIPIVTAASILILKLNEKAEIHGDAAIGLVSATSVAAGVLIASLARGFNVDLFSYLFGSILIISDVDVIITAILAVLVIGIIFIFYNSFFAITFDEEFSSVIGLKTKTMNYIISILTSMTIVIGIRIVGTMLISSLVIFPTITALQISKGFKSTMIISAAIALFSVVVGIFVSFIFDLPSGATIVLINAVCFAGSFGFKRLIGV